VVGCDPTRSTSRERGRRRSAYEASERNGRSCPSLGGAESKRRRRPRSRGPQSWVALLARLCLREHHPRRRVPVGGPLEGADQEPRRAAQTEAAQALEAPLPREPAHDALQVSDREARALELGHQLLAPPELVVDRVIMRAPRAV